MTKAVKSNFRELLEKIHSKMGLKKKFHLNSIIHLVGFFNTTCLNEAIRKRFKTLLVTVGDEDRLKKLMP